MADNENFIAYIKFSLKQNLCKTIDFDCWVHDYMAAESSECILTDEGYEIIKEKYRQRINELLESMRMEHEKEEYEQIYHDINEKQYSETDFGYSLTSDTELPFN